MRDRLHATAGLVQVGDGVVVDDHQLVAIAFGRAIDRPLRVERGARDEEDRLRDDPRRQVLTQRVELFSHRSI